MEVGQTGLSGLSLSSTRPSPLRAQGEATGRNVRQRGEYGQPIGVNPQMPGIMASSLETVAEGPPEEDSLDGVLDSMQMPEIIGTLLSEEGSLKAPITMVVMADGSGKAGAMNQDVLSEVIDEFAVKEAFLTYLENEAGASFKVAAHLTIDEAGAASLYDVAGGGKAYKGIKVYTMAEAAGIPAYAARMEGVVVLFFTQTPSGLDVSNPEHLKLFGEMVTLFFTARTGGKTFLEMRATQLLTSGIITTTEAAKYKNAIISCKDAKPISTFGGSWTGKRGNIKTMNKIYVVASFKDSGGKPFTPSFLPQKMAISDKIAVRTETAQGAGAAASTNKEAWAATGTKKISALCQDFGILYQNFCPFHAAVHAPGAKCSQFQRYIQHKMSQRALAKQDMQSRAAVRATTYANALASTSRP